VQQVWSVYTKHLEEEINSTLEENLDHKLQPLYNVYKELEIGDQFIDYYIKWVTKKQIETVVRQLDSDSLDLQEFTMAIFLPKVQ
jgi:hypothetical protein